MRRWMAALQCSTASGRFREWIEQSQTIAFNLQIESQRIDRSEPALQLYLLTRDEDKYHFV